MATNHATEVVSVTPAAMTKSVSRGLIDLLLKQAAERPRHHAIVYKSEQVEFQSLVARATAIAKELRALGVKHGDRVGLLFPNHPHYIAAFFAATGIGATVVPINPLLRSEEITHILCDSKAKALVVADCGWSEVVKASPHLSTVSSILVVRLNRDSCVDTSKCSKINRILESETLNQALSDNTFDWCEPFDADDQLAVLVYTSGTTGKPKGAMLTHANLMNTITVSHRIIEITSDDRFLVVLPLCHIYGLSVVMLGILSKGGTLFVMEKFDPVEALDLIERYKLTGLPAVPAMYQFMIMELEKNPSRRLESLRVCLSGASAMPLELLERLNKVFQAPILEGYGLTETSSVVSLNPIHGRIKPSSVGLPLPPIEVAIAGPDGTHLPAGSEFVGEILIKGPNVMVGYWGKPEATAECLRDGWFATGDLGYKDGDGYLYIVGRSKELIIRGGQNIYPREIEDVISSMKEVLEVAVIGVPDQFMGERVKAYVVLRTGETLSDEDVKLFCADHLAEYKVPRLVEFIGSLPRNSTGKILKRMLESN